MNRIIDYIIELLNKDMVSHGFLVQCVEQEGQQQISWKEVLKELLSSGIEIGTTRLLSNYVEFIAWKGMIEERLIRADKLVVSLPSDDREFAYWLALREKVDRFEENNDPLSS